MKLAFRALKKFQLLQLINLNYKSGEIKIPVIRGLGYNNISGTELWMKELLEKLLPKINGSFVDVGVNVGQTLLKVKRLDCNFPYIGFEPNPNCVFYVEELIKKNRFTKCEIVPVGISDTNTIVSLQYFSHDLTDSSASIIEGFRTGTAIALKKNIVVCNYDMLQEKFQMTVGLVKIDVEGAELNVIQGLRQLLTREKPLILMEILPVYQKENTNRLQRQEEIERIMHGMDYQTLRILKNSQDKFEGFERVSVIGIHADVQKSDYLFCPTQRINEFLSI